MAASLACLGLLFTVWCACHCANTCSGCYSEGFGPPKRGSAHPFNVLFEVFHLIRNKIGVSIYFVITAAYLNKLMKEAGGEAYVAAGSPTVTGGGLQKGVGKKLGDTPMDMRWESIQKGALSLLSSTPIIVDPFVLPWLVCSSHPLSPHPLPDLNATRLPNLNSVYDCPQAQAKAGITDVSLIALIILGFKACEFVHGHRWWAKPSQDKETFGSDPLLSVLQAQLADPFILAQFHFIVVVYHLVLQPAFALAKLNEAGGGARYTLKDRIIIRDLLRENQDVKAFSCWPEVEKIPNLVSRVLFFHAATRVMKAMLDKAEEHLEHAAMNVLLALGDDDLQKPLLDMLFLLLIAEGLAQPDPPDFFAFPSELPPYSFICNQKELFLRTAPQQVAEDVREMIERNGGVTAIVGYDRLLRFSGKFNILKGMLKFREDGCVFDMSDMATVLCAFFIFYHEVPLTGNKTSMVVEIAVNKTDEVLRPIKGSGITAQGLEQRLATEEQRLRMQRRADEEVQVPAACHCASCEDKRTKRAKRRTGGEGGEEEEEEEHDKSLSGSGTVHSKGKGAGMHHLVQCAKFAARPFSPKCRATRAAQT